MTTNTPNYQTLITADELRQLLGRDRVRVVDCRFDLMDPAAGRRSYLEAHIPGAAYFDLDEDMSAPVEPATGRHPLPDAETLASVFSRAGIDESVQVVVYDDNSGALAARAWWLLRWMGHDRAAILDGGLSAWRSAKFPLVSGQESIAARKFRGSPRTELVVETREIAQLVASGADFALVDARDEARFVGESEPIDTVAGHIPGAVNLPYSRMLRDDGTCRTAAELGQLWAGALGDDNANDAIVMCGSGVTACHLVMTAIRAGCREPRVYIGSWSEWIRDARRPVAIGAPGNAESE